MLVVGGGALPQLTDQSPQWRSTRTLWRGFQKSFEAQDSLFIAPEIRQRPAQYEQRGTSFAFAIVESGLSFLQSFFVLLLLQVDLSQEIVRRPRAGVCG